jgi:hypothetical protein
MRGFARARVGYADEFGLKLTLGGGIARSFRVVFGMDWRLAGEVLRLAT